eukprot:TRINITY_DN11897_c0_g1_i1.p1 TRINITY_DN11897_c0_g1~~TRINITY_DN11897_c0_g1_i1.p1  ORF type:complete len:495 (+),score=93.60 TRINITY_DN11897_c0_g1_i1:25-1485(+)
MEQLVSVIIDPDTSDVNIKRHIRQLPRAEPVPVVCIVKLMGKFGSFSLAIRLAILKWIVAVLKRVDNQEQLHLLYPMFFHYLGYDNLRPALCQILVYLTRRSDIVPFRHRRLLALNQRCGSDPNILGLLLLYRDLDHTIIVPAAARPLKGATRPDAMPIESSLLDTTESVRDQMTAQLMEDWLKLVLRTWDGELHYDHVVRLISKLTPRRYVDIYDDILRPLQRVVVYALPLGKANVIQTYTALTRQWLLADWTGLPRNEILSELIKHVNQMCTIALQVENNHTLVHHAALSFYELIGSIGTVFAMPFVRPPPASAIYRGLLSTTAIPVSRMCGLLVQYKSEFERIKAVHTTSPGDLVPGNGLDYIREFNVFITDFCDALYKSSLFRTTSADSLLSVPEDVLSRVPIAHKMSALAPSQSVVFGATARRFLEEDESLAGQMLTPVLMKDRRLQYLEYLRLQGYEGLHKFLFTFMKSLVDRLRMAQQG